MRINIEKYVKWLEQQVDKEATQREIARYSGLLDGDLPNDNDDEWYEIHDAIRDVAYEKGYVLENNFRDFKNGFYPIGFIVRKIEENDCLKMLVDGTDFRFGISLPERDKAGIHEEDLYYGFWFDVYLHICNKYFLYHRKSEMLDSDDIKSILEMLEKAVNNKLEKDEELGFTEPDLEMIFNKYSSGEPSVDIKVYLPDDGVYTPNHYCFNLYGDEVIKFYEYLKSAYNKIMNELIIIK
ncbi:MAG: hypothetical protein IJ115_09885 [Erysipelotrichaceae bacterium]|nr:hypothetical protein [Erysipelotrichaceae bacterium]